MWSTERVTCVVKKGPGGFKFSKNFSKQESPPAWTQKAYRPLCSKYTLCCLWWGYSPPPRPGWGVPLPRSGQEGYPLPRSERGGTPFPDLDGGYFLQKGWGYPPPIGGWGTPPPQVWIDTQTENITFPHPSDAGGKYKVFLCFSFSPAICHVRIRRA